jgi:hypothetical protein
MVVDRFNSCRPVVRFKKGYLPGVRFLPFYEQHGACIRRDKLKSLAFLYPLPREPGPSISQEEIMCQACDKAEELVAERLNMSVDLVQKVFDTYEEVMNELMENEE